MTAGVLRRAVRSTVLLPWFILRGLHLFLRAYTARILLASGVSCVVAWFVVGTRFYGRPAFIAATILAAGGILLILSAAVVSVVRVPDHRLGPRGGPSNP